MKNEPIVIERTFNATLEQVWKAITDKDEMKKWYFDLPEFKAEVGFCFQFTGGKEGGVQYAHHCEIIEVVHEQKLKQTWCYVVPARKLVCLIRKRQRQGFRSQGNGSLLK